MKLKIFLTLIFSFLLISNTSAQTPEAKKNIKLKDGTILKGRVISMEDGVYTIRTPYLNEIAINEEDIETISDHVVQPLTQDLLRNEVEAVQGQVIANPALMQEIQETMNNPKIREIMQDPEFINAVMSMDPEAIKNNEKTYEMLQQPEIKELFQKIESTLNNTQTNP